MHWAKSLIIDSFIVTGMLIRLSNHISREVAKLVSEPKPETPPVPPRPPSWSRSVPLRTPVQEIASMKRAVGYCKNTHCEDYSKGTFLLNHGNTFYCPRCTQLGMLVAEEGNFAGTSEHGIYQEVRVEYNYDPIQAKYCEIGIVRDDSLLGHHQTYTLQSPLIKTEKRALKVAEAILANLNRYRTLSIDMDGIPGTAEVILNFDLPLKEFTAECQRLGQEWANSPLAQFSRDQKQEKKEGEGL